MVRKVHLIVILCILLTLTGCWNRRELNELAIAMGMGIDKQGERFKVSIQVVVPSEIAAKKGRGASPVVTYSAVGDSVFEAIRTITTGSPRKIYISHLRILVLGETLARDGIGKALEFLTRDSEARPDFYIAVAKDAMAEDILKVLTPLDAIPASMLFSSLETSQEAWAPTVSVTLDKVLSDMTSEGKQPTLTGITVQGDPPAGNNTKNVQAVDTPARLQYTTMAVFRKDKLIGWLNETESKGYNYIQDKIKSTVGLIRCPEGGYLTVEVIRSKTKVKGKVINGKPRIDIDVRMEVNIGEVNCKIDLTKNQTIAEIKKRGEVKVRQLILDVIHKVQREYKVDIFGFGQTIRRSNPKAWEKMKKDWDRYFVNLDLHVKVDQPIHRLGVVSNSFLDRIKE